MGFFDDVGGFFEHTLPNAAADVANTSWGAVKTVGSTVFNGAVSGINRVTDVAERGANTAIDVGGGFGKAISNPILLGMGALVAILVLSKI